MGLRADCFRHAVGVALDQFLGEIHERDSHAVGVKEQINEIFSIGLAGVLLIAKLWLPKWADVLGQQEVENILYWFEGSPIDDEVKPAGKLADFPSNWPTWPLPLMGTALMTFGW